MAATKRRIVDLLSAEFDGDGDVNVIYGPAGTRTFTSEIIVTVGNMTFTNTVATMGDFGDGYDETYDVALVVEATSSGTDQQIVTERALTFYDRAVAALKAGPGDTAGIPGVMWARPTGRGDVIEAADERTLRKGRSTAIPFNINVMAVL